MNLKYKDIVSEKEVKNLISDLREKLKKARSKVNNNFKDLNMDYVVDFDSYHSNDYIK